VDGYKLSHHTLVEAAIILARLTVQDGLDNVFFSEHKKFR